MAEAQKLTGPGVRLARTEFTLLPLQSSQASVSQCFSFVQEGKKEKKLVVSVLRGVSETIRATAGWCAGPGE